MFFSPSSTNSGKIDHLICISSDRSSDDIGVEELIKEVRADDFEHGTSCRSLVNELYSSVIKDQHVVDDSSGDLRTLIEKLKSVG